MLIPFIALSVIVVGALLIVQLGANALVLTGLSQATARFQACSAFFGVGFTTHEAEMVVDHPVRRRIIVHLIVAGNIGITSGLATLIVTVLKSDPGQVPELLILLLSVAAALAVGLLFNIPWIKRPLDRVMKWSLESAGVVRAMDYDVLLNLRQGYSVSEVELVPGHAYCGRRLGESRPADGGIVVLGIHRGDGTFVGAPGRDELLSAGDRIMVYGSNEASRRLHRLVTPDIGAGG